MTTRPLLHHFLTRSASIRSLTLLKYIGDGAFSTVYLCDWHGALSPGTPLPAMQWPRACRPEYTDKRLVAVKRMKPQWADSWENCTQSKEFIALREIPIHPNIVLLYDCFFVPEKKELYFVFEPMEGNMYEFMKSRRGQTLAGVLVTSISHQIASGLSHIHSSGFFHRDLKPENILVTTIGMCTYPNTSPGAPPELDVVVVIKITDFGLARKMASKPPYTELWGLGAVIAELVNLRPLFPGKGELDQIHRITAVLGNPSGEHVARTPSAVLGGGEWVDGVRLAHGLGFQFLQTPPVDLSTLFDRKVPRELVKCIAGLLKYDPAARLTSAQCIEHPYFRKMAPFADLVTRSAFCLQPPPLSAEAVREKFGSTESRPQMGAGLAEMSLAMRRMSPAASDSSLGSTMDSAPKSQNSQNSYKSRLNVRMGPPGEIPGRRN
ncbi:kinase-like protein [Artomyces pyxidatus]|uniref:Kinase-like protein n=1 Tax=Artomyces pyxidatus TaxID=48021 RepID=A0ACB8T3D8_9AGAM|nr:kinase-like protein [Artomyces pyxidatus]